MTIKSIWIFAFSISMVLVGLTLSGFAHASPTGSQIADAAMERTEHSVRYDGSYVSISYPGGDVPADQGVCTDVVVRTYRSLGIDLQRLVHEDMSQAFSTYPANWGLNRPDRNIDHRRVPNLQIFFSRHGELFKVSDQATDYQPGDLVTWMVASSLPHIGIISAERSLDGARPLIIHNIGQGPQLEDRLFAYPITGHYRYPRNVA
jgi:uncharacterized protein YijF (DUF1287 family)